MVYADGTLSTCCLACDIPICSSSPEKAARLRCGSRNSSTSEKACLVRLLFVKESLAWPRSSGHDVHCYQMMRALTRLGHAVALATAKEPAPEAVHGLNLEWRSTLDALLADAAGPQLSRLQER